MSNLKKFRRRQIINIGIGILSFAALALMIHLNLLPRAYRSLIIPVGVNIILAVSLNLVAGYLGELSLGHAGFMAIGAYASAIITSSMEASAIVEITLALLGGGVIAAGFGILIGMPVLRLKGDYLAIVTLAFGEIIRSIVNALPITGGAMGISQLTPYTTYKNFILVFLIVIITLIVVSNLVRSRHGRTISAVRDNYIATQSIGIKVSRIKLMAFTIGAFFAGIAGVIYAHNITIIKPDNFDYNKSIEILVIVVLGGMGNIPGSIIAAIILTLLPQMLRSVDDFRMLFYSIVLIAMMILNESGVKKRFLESGGFKNLIRRRKKEVA